MQLPFQVNRKLLEYEQKFADLVTEIARTKEDGLPSTFMPNTSDASKTTKNDPLHLTGYSYAPMATMGSAVFLTNMVSFLILF